jgi:hypothetical protein
MPKENMNQVACFLRDRLKLEASAEKSKVSKASDGAVFLGYRICTVSGGRSPACSSMVFRVRLAQEGTPFRHEMEHRRISRLHREPPWACHARAHKHQAASTNGFQPTV